MRRIHTNEVVLLIAGLLLAAAVVFAWIRSRSAPVAPGVAAASSAAESVEGAGFDWRVIGAQTYEARCASCHAEGQGTQRVPPLRGDAVELFKAEGGRAYLADFLLYGLERHPAYEGRLSDDEAAAVLNYMLTAWENAALLAADQPLYEPRDLVEHRNQPLTPAQVRTRRPPTPIDPDR
ncbi:MAG: cytochrome c [Phycisphaerales bacterium]|nr:cytochrome c [Phycisphaerales bacterium]